MIGFIIGLAVGAVAAFALAEREHRIEYQRGVADGRLEATRMWIASMERARRRL